MNNLTQNDNLYQSVKNILQTARDNAYRQVNFIMVEAYWNIGKQIVEEEQNGKDRAEYGSYLIKELSSRLTSEFGKGFTASNLKMMRQFYLAFPIGHTLCDQLSWSHYRLIMRLDNPQARLWYMEESAKANWSVRALERQIGTFYYERIISSKDKQPVIAEATSNTKDLQLTPKDIIKDPYVLEFLDLKQNNAFYESDLESALIEKIQEFLLELGRGFAFVARQKRVKTETSDFYIDLVFYHRILRCHLLIDLKVRPFEHGDVGQMGHVGPAQIAAPARQLHAFVVVAVHLLPGEEAAQEDHLAVGPHQVFRRVAAGRSKRLSAATHARCRSMHRPI